MKKQIIIEMRKRRYTYEYIGKLLGISRQRVYQIEKKIYLKATCFFCQTKKEKKSFHRLCEKHEYLSKLEGRNLLREKVRIRDNHTCQICFKKWEKGKRRFDVHHLDPEEEGKKGNIYKNNIDFTKLITLCHKCHLNLDSVKKKTTSRWTRLTPTPGS